MASISQCFSFQANGVIDADCIKVGHCFIARVEVAINLKPQKTCCWLDLLQIPGNCLDVTLSQRDQKNSSNCCFHQFAVILRVFAKHRFGSSWYICNCHLVLEVELSCFLTYMNGFICDIPTDLVQKTFFTMHCCLCVFTHFDWNEECVLETAYEHFFPSLSKLH